MNREMRVEGRRTGIGARRAKSSSSRLWTHRARRLRAAFSLLEVMIAIGIFFMAMFAILGLVANVLSNARWLQHTTVDAGMVASQLSLTNKLVEQVDSGDFGDVFPDYEWTSDAYEVATNRLFQVDYIVQRRSGRNTVESKMSILLFRPDSPPGSLDGVAGPRP
jgi:hypothetical protein